MTASAPRWPADATLLREVFRAARRKHWSRVFGDGSSEHLPDGVTVVAEWDQDGSLITLTRWPSGGLRIDLCGVVEMDVVSEQVAVDTLVAWGVLPAELSTAYHKGHDVGHAEGVHAVEDAALETRFDVYLDELWGRLKDSDVLGAIGDELDGVLDRQPFVRRRQVERVVNVVLNAAGVGDDA
jgi:hypothetical protein